ncbi:MAG TPA: hypothetical protein H9875_07945 [Candidatus Levilactobacillus faecigallinarum]|uniref:AbrB family transcriptional regulator n=1 Tax=Candidatus Levilactobacillus faecigallinarum TaxID=2838638 RepID=A0A9D1U680_9LACO|nr:hypothetical protein [Candidatus Levilactobacillus faecigallinarum]
MKVKTRKQGNSLMITIPSSFEVPESTEYIPVMDENGIISFKHQAIEAVKDIFDVM